MYNAIQIQSGVECTVCSQDNQNSFHGLNMKNEAERLFTYDTWTHDTVQPRGPLAKAGLYYTGTEDKVKCAFCCGILKKWLKTDVPFDEHARHFPRCRFIRGYEVGNIPIEHSEYFGNGDNISYDYLFSNSNNYSNAYHVLRPSHNGYIPSPPEDINSTPEHLNNSSTQIVTPSSNQAVLNGIYANNGDFQDFYKNEEKRRMSFSRWPLDLPQTPEILAAAGFYHDPTDGKQDRVKCGYCSGKLYNWKGDDDPWIEHARCFPECPYVELCMGKDVLRDLLNQPRPTQNGYDETLRQHFTHPEELYSSAAEASTTARPVSPAPSSESKTGAQDSVSVRMTSEPVQAVLEMGFAEEMVKQTVERCLRDRPGNFPPAEELASMVMELEDQQPAAAAAPAPVQSPLQRLMAARRSGNDVNSSQTATSSGQDDHTRVDRVNIVKQGQSSGPTVNKDKIKCENSRLKDQLLCKICMENYVRVTFMPCGHLVCCGPCSMAVSSCPICRASITDYVRTYF